MAVYIPDVDRRPELFLSHSSIDKNFVRELAKDLNVCEVDVWFDEWEISAGDSITSFVSEGLEKSKFVSVIISKAYVNGKWTIEELNAVLNKQIDKNTKIILPLLIEDTTIPTLLRDKLYIDFRENYFYALTRLAGLVHGLTLKIISQAIEKIKPTSLEKVLDTLIYAGKDPYMIIPKDVFDEIVATGKAEVNGERLRFNPNYVLSSKDLSERAMDYITRVRVGAWRNRKNRMAQ